MAQKWLGITLDDWQLHALAYLTAFDPESGLWVHSQAGLVVARQNGKTQLMQALVLWCLLTGRRVVAGAQNLSESVSTWRDVAGLFLEDGPLAHMLASKVLRHGEEAVELTNGGYYRVVATNRRSARGLRAVDLLWLDEVRELKTWEPMGAMTPTTATSPNPMTVVTSNAGETDSVVLNDWRDRGREGSNPRMAWLEWSTDPHAPLDDLAAARQANPSPRIPDTYLADQLASLPAARYRVEHLCQWVDSLGGAIPREAWDALAAPEPGDVASWWLSFAIQEDRGAAIILAGGRAADGMPHLGVVEGWADGVTHRDLAEGVARAVETYKPAGIAYNGWTGHPVAHMMSRLRLNLVDTKGQTYVTGCQLLLDHVTNGRLRHDGHPDVAPQIASAVKREGSRGGWWWDRTRSTGPIVAVEAASQLLGVLEPENTPPRPLPVTATGVA